jgi:G3E family GTPase
MALRATIMNGLTSTYLESCSTSLMRRSPRTVGLVYSRPGGGDQSLQFHCYDESGLLDSGDVAMKHECLSCLVREHTYEELRKLDGLDRWTDALITFPPGVDPGAFPHLVDAFQGDDAPDFTLTVDTCLAVIDAVLLGEQLSSVELLRDWSLSVFGADERTIGEVLSRQIEFADRLLLANMHRIAPADRTGLIELMTMLNAEADHVSLDSQGRCFIPSIGLNRFDLDAARRQNPLSSNEAPHPVRGEHFQSLVWHRTRPMHPGRLATALEDNLPGSIRTRGQLWFATHPEKQICWESSGPMCSIAALSSWEHVPSGAECFLYLVGEDLDEKGLIEALDATLLTDEEYAADVSSWRAFENPFANDMQLSPVEETDQ